MRTDEPKDLIRQNTCRPYLGESLQADMHWTDEQEHPDTRNVVSMYRSWDVLFYVYPNIYVYPNFFHKNDSNLADGT